MFEFKTLPHPDEPTNATVLPGLILSDKLFKICVSGRLGYLKLTFLNFISPYINLGISPSLDSISIDGTLLE